MQGERAKTRFGRIEMRNKRKLILWVTILGLAVASILIVAGCGDETTDTTAAPATTQATTATTTAATTATTTAATTATTVGKEVLIRVTTPVPAGDEMATMAQEGFDRFNARTNGAYTLKIFTGGELGPMPEMLDAVRTGSVEAGLFPLAAYGGTVPEFGLVELPFLFNNGEANSAAMPGIQPIWDELAQAKANQRVFGCLCTGTVNFLSVKKLLKTIDDLKGIVFGCDNPAMSVLVNTLGGSGTVVDFTEDYSNLQKGIFDAKTSAPQYIHIAKLYEIAKYYTVFHGIGTLYAFNVNLDVYNEMPKDIQDALAEELSATAKSLSEMYVSKFYELEPVLKDLGMQYYYLPTEEREKWKELGYPVTLDTISKAGDIGTRVKQVVDEANAKFPYVQEQ